MLTNEAEHEAESTAAYNFWMACQWERRRHSHEILRRMPRFRYHNPEFDPDPTGLEVLGDRELSVRTNDWTRAEVLGERLFWKVD